jgi:autotransporter-associated beta strand protein
VADATGNADADLTISNGVRNAYLTNVSTNLQKTGLGTMVLSGSNIYSGTTTVSAGTLLVNGRLANTSAVSVSAGAVLGGTGSIASGVTSAVGGVTGEVPPFSLGNCPVS